MGSKYEVYSNRVEPHDAPPPGPPKPIPRPRWEMVARLVEGTELRAPLPPTDNWAIGGTYARLDTGEEFTCRLEVSGRVLATAERLRSAFLLGGEREVENHLAPLRKIATDDVSRMYINDVEAVLRLLLGAGDEARHD